MSSPNAKTAPSSISFVTALSRTVPSSASTSAAGAFSSRGSGEPELAAVVAPERGSSVGTTAMSSWSWWSLSWSWWSLSDMVGEVG